MSPAKLAITSLRVVFACGIKSSTSRIGVRCAVNSAARIDVYIDSLGGKRLAHIAQRVPATRGKEVTAFWQPESQLRSGPYVFVVEASSTNGQRARVFKPIVLVR